MAWKKFPTLRKLAEYIFKTLSAGKQNTKKKSFKNDAIVKKTVRLAFDTAALLSEAYRPIWIFVVRI